MYPPSLHNTAIVLSKITATQSRVIVLYTTDKYRDGCTLHPPVLHNTAFVLSSKITLTHKRAIVLHTSENADGHILPASNNQPFRLAAVGHGKLFKTKPFPNTSTTMLT